MVCLLVGLGKAKVCLCRWAWGGIVWGCCVLLFREDVLRRGEGGVLIFRYEGILFGRRGGGGVGWCGVFEGLKLAFEKH